MVGYGEQNVKKYLNYASRHHGQEENFMLYIHRFPQ